MRNSVPAIGLLDGSMPSAAKDGAGDRVARAPRSGCLMLIVRHLVRGGAERLLSSIVHRVRAFGVPVLVVRTGRTPAGYADDVSWFADAAVGQVCLPDRGARKDWPALVVELIRRCGVTALAVSDSDDGYRLLPAIRAAAPAIWVCDLQYNPLAQIENNRRFSHFIDLTVAQSRRTADAIVAAGGAPERIVLNPGGIDLAAFEPDEAARVRARQALAIGPSAFVVGFLARFDPTKNPLGFLDLARRRPEAGWTFLLAGGGPIDAAVDQAMRTMPPSLDVRRLGPVADSRPFFDAIDVLALTSLNEGRPLAVMEAAAMGRPVVAMAVGGVPELIDHGVTGFLCPPGDLDAMAGHLDRLAASADERADMGRRARMRALRDFDLRSALPRYAAAILGP